MAIIERLGKIKLIPVAVLDHAADACPLAQALIDSRSNPHYAHGLS